MFNPTAADLLVYIFATIYLMSILALGATRLANSGKGKLSALVCPVRISKCHQCLGFLQLAIGRKTSVLVRCHTFGVLASLRRLCFNVQRKTKACGAGIRDYWISYRNICDDFRILTNIVTASKKRRSWGKIDKI